MQILIKWLCQNPADLDLHCFPKRIYLASAEQEIRKETFIVFSNYKINVLSCQQKRYRQTVQTQIRLLLQKQSDQGLPCLLFRQAFCEISPDMQTEKVYEILEHLPKAILLHVKFHFYFFLGGGGGLFKKDFFFVILYVT